MDIKEKLQNIVLSCKELMEEMAVDSEKKLDSSLQINFDSLKNTAKKFRYTNDSFNEIDDGTKYSYIKIMIYLFNKVNDKDLEIVLLHIEKIHFAMGIELSVEEELVRSHGYDEKTIMRFVKELTSMPNNSSQMFVMDTLMVLASISSVDTEILRNISAVISKLGFNKKQIKELFDLSGYITKKDKDKFNAFISKDYSIELQSLYPYFKGCFEGLLSNTNQLLWINNNFSVTDFYNLFKKNTEKSWSSEYEWYSRKGKKFVVENVCIDISKSINLEFENIVFKGCNITISSKHRDNIFEKCKSIVFDNCKININGSEYLRFENCEDIIMRTCEFTGTCSQRCFTSANCKKIKIENCKFRDFEIVRQGDDSYRYSATQGCFQINDSEQVDIIGSSFKGCCTRHYERGNVDGAVGAFFSTKKIKINNCVFNNCKNYSWQYGTHWDEINYMFVFSKDITPEMDKNEYNNCAEVYKNSGRFW